MPAGTFYLRQQHSSQVVEIAGQEPAGDLSADAVFTRSTRPVSVITADCLPILVGCTSGRFVAAIHAGWKGLLGGVIANALGAFSQAGIERQSLRIAIGPGIMACCYEVPTQLTQELQRIHGRLWSGNQPPWFVVRPCQHANSAVASHGEAWLSLARYCTLLLLAEGIEAKHIEASNLCTYCSGLGLASYRRRHHRAEAKAFQYSWIRCLS
ncbi:conserved hypothetical protein [Pseudomonas flavescens]|uniref:YfiH family protein n=2 Tax=Phytopseudomonas flavescens TaxID=29435 RepID=A0A1G8EXZ7_9GAMM|nr:conserved hypothetical protein [Pseudomonas flavescens]